MDHGGETVRVVVDLDLCQSHGECVTAAPDIFELGDDDLLRWRAEVDEAKRAEIETAIELCPMAAIKLEG